jgi:hypothetical protein
MPILLDVVRRDHLGAHELADPRDGLLAAGQEADPAPAKVILEVHPRAPARRAAGRAAELLRAIRAVLKLALDNRGTSMRDFVDAEGRSGDNEAALLVYGRAGEPCRVCGAPVRRSLDSGRSTFFCPRYQKR